MEEARQTVCDENREWPQIEFNGAVESAQVVGCMVQGHDVPLRDALQVGEYPDELPPRMADQLQRE